MSVKLLSPELEETLYCSRFSGVVQMKLHGQICLEHVAGQKRLDGGQPIELSTRFSVASITKMFTAVCVMQLVEQGTVGLDATLVSYLPEIEGKLPAGVTVDGLLTHRSGLGDYLDDDAALPFVDMPVEQLDHVRAFLPYVLDVQLHEPGRFRYSSAGYVLLGLLIEKVTGLSYQDAVKQMILEPAELSQSGFDAMDAPELDFAMGVLDDGQSNLTHLPAIGGPDGGILTNVTDLVAFWEWLNTRSGLRREYLELFWDKVTVHNPSVAYGRGFDVLTFADQTWCGHTGSDPGISARVVFARESDSHIIVLCNRSSIAFKTFRLIRDALINRPPNG
ncbi:MAG: hypothetical protein CMJ19_12850 [Phycisphaeraceae bacterium]|nr:hypothetical protein [Phycisphaeraceae bacterium]